LKNKINEENDKKKGAIINNEDQNWKTDKMKLNYKGKNQKNINAKDKISIKKSRTRLDTKKSNEIK